MPTFEAHVAHVTPFRFREPQAGETAKTLRRASDATLTKSTPHGIADQPVRLAVRDSGRTVWLTEPFV